MASKSEATTIDVDEDTTTTPPRQERAASVTAPDTAPSSQVATTHLIASPSKKSRAFEEGASQHDDYASAAGDEDAEMSDGAAPSPIADRRSGKRGVARHPYGMQQQGQYGHEKRRVDDKLLDEPIRQRYLKEIGDIFAQPAAPAP